MATGIDAAASITAVISFSVAVFNGCVKAYQLLSAAKHADREVSSVSCMIEWEEHRFIQWGIRIGLARDSSSRNPDLPWQLIRETLNQLDQLFKDSERLKSAYGLSREQSAAHEDESSNHKKVAPRIWPLVDSEAKAVRARSGQLNIGQRFRWIALDQKKIRNLVYDLGQFNKRLYDLLAVHDRDYIRYALSTLLQDLVSRAASGHNLNLLRALNDPDSVDQSKAIEAAADLKQIRMHIKFDQREGETTQSFINKPTVNRLKYNSFSSLSGNGKRQTAVYRSSKRPTSSVVLLEWKRVPKSLESKLKARVEGLALLLSNARDESFNIPPCLGYVRRDDDEGPFSWYAHCYQLKLDHEDGSAQPGCSVRTLAQLIGADKEAPSLTERIGYSSRLTGAVLQLHTSGWLHKSIQPDNLIFVTDATPGGAIYSQKGPFLTGFEYARADNPLEMTEDPTRSTETKRYVHPELQKHSRPSFSKAHDLYSLGCVLAEIAVWQSLDSVLRDKAVDWSDLQSAPALKYILTRVAFHAGNTYADAVRLCFQPITAQRDVPADEDGETDNEDSLETSVLTQLQIVSLLRKCKV